ncbi:Putative ribonuclease H protein At1g65750 [Linum perenne]
MVGDHYVVILNWRPYFRPEDSSLSTLRVWVRLPGLPLEYFDYGILKRIGTTVRIDHTTLEGAREPKTSKRKAESVIRKMGFASSYRADARGFKGGVWIVWDPLVITLTILDSGDQFIHAEGSLSDGSKYFITAVYASPRPTRRVLLWDMLKQIAGAADIVEILGMGTTNDLGRYLGVPILHGRVTKQTYNFVLDRLDNRLADWKADNLSLAGRVTLASSVLNSIPSYIMQTAFLPVYLCDQIDKKIRNFIWGSTKGSRRIHNVNWQIVCKPKCLGGLGLRSARDLNKAFLMKLVWGVLSNPNDLWVQVLLTKYMKKTEEGWRPKRRSGFSATWRGMLSVWSDTINGLQWSVRDGTRTKFWTDIWLDSGATLIDFATDLQGVNPLNSVSDFFLVNGAWDFNKLESCLPPEIILQIGGMTPPRAGAGEDVLVWGLEDNGRFSIKSTYALLQDFRLEDRNRKWQQLWKWQGPNKIKHFMWLAMQGKLMTNVERARRHITNSDTCAVCGSEAESLDHVFRGCDVAKGVWNACLPQVLSQMQRHWDFNSWWSNNIGDRSLNPSFGVIVWLLWSRRNKLVFEGVTWSIEEVSNHVKFRVLLLSSSWKAGQLGREAPGIARQTQLIRWRPADEEWFTLNSDGSLYTQDNRADAGGIIRDCRGNFVSSFAINLGSCSIMRAELRGIIEGMNLAWEKGIRKLCIQTDSRAAVDVLSCVENRLNRHTSLVQQFQDLKSRDWVVQIQHIYREANFAADYMANLDHSFELGTHVFQVPDSSLLYWLRYDLIGVCEPRIINIT